LKTQVVYAARLGSKLAPDPMISSTAMDVRTAKCLLVSKVLVADGMVTENERAFLDKVMSGMGLTAIERHAVLELQGWDEAEPIVAKLDDQEKRDLVQTMIEAAASDGKLSALEAKAMRNITKALGLT
jgi:uncharacterized tellurite resistance protein B-like protein